MLTVDCPWCEDRMVLDDAPMTGGDVRGAAASAWSSPRIRAASRSSSPPEGRRQRGWSDVVRRT